MTPNISASKQDVFFVANGSEIIAEETINSRLKALLHLYYILTSVSGKVANRYQVLPSQTLFDKTPSLAWPTPDKEREIEGERKRQE